MGDTTNVLTYWQNGATRVECRQVKLGFQVIVFRAGQPCGITNYETETAARQACERMAQDLFMREIGHALEQAYPLGYRSEDDEP